MPIIDVKRQGVRPSVRKVPTSTCAVPMPMTLGAIGKETRSGSEIPVTVDSVHDAFEKFKPSLKFTGRAGPKQTEFKAEYHFRGVQDFDPNNIMARQELKNEDGSTTPLQNDLADLHDTIQLLHRLRERWSKLPAIRRAWADESQRKEIIDAIQRLMGELNKVAGSQR